MTPSNEMWAHQAAMVDWLEERQAGLIAAGMGCGKSRTAIEATRHLDAVFIACPPAVGPAWQKQYRMFEPRRLFVDLIDGPVKKRAERLKDARASGRPFVAVSNYEAMWRSPLVATTLSQHSPAFGLRSREPTSFSPLRTATALRCGSSSGFHCQLVSAPTRSSRHAPSPRPPRLSKH